MTETIMLKELKKGSERALEWFISRYTGYVSTIIYNIIGEHMDASDIEDVTADVFFTFWQQRKVVRTGHIRGYLAVLARNKAKNKCRQMHFPLPLEDHMVTVQTTPGPEYTAQQKELSKAVRNAVLNMPVPDREIFLRFYFCYQTAEQISQEMQINLSTVKTKLRRGREKLKTSLSNYLL